MIKPFVEPYIDEGTGILIVPSPQGVLCLGDGEHGYECCCDECDYYLDCFPQYRRDFKALFEKRAREKAEQLKNK